MSLGRTGPLALNHARCFVQCYAKPLKYRFANMVVVIAGNLANMERNARIRSNRIEKLSNTFGGKISNFLASEVRIEIELTSPADIHCHKDKSFIHHGVV